VESRLHRALKFAVAAAGFALLVGVVGSAIAGPEHRGAVWSGAAVALVIQLVLCLLLFRWVFAGRPLLAHGVGMLGRLTAVGLLALFWVPWAGVPAAPLLFSVLAVFFLTTLLEPLFLFSFSGSR
jgi:hypothetical protein